MRIDIDIFFFTFAIFLHSIELGSPARVRNLNQNVRSYTIQNGEIYPRVTNPDNPIVHKGFIIGVRHNGLWQHIRIGQVPFALHINPKWSRPLNNEETRIMLNSQSLPADANSYVYGPFENEEAETNRRLGWLGSNGTIRFIYPIIRRSGQNSQAKSRLDPKHGYSSSGSNNWDF